MPTYEYVCAKCGHEFDLVQSMKDDAVTTCPKDKCAQKKWGKGKVRRMMGAGAGLIFKGSGFYITDYRSEKYKEAAKKDSSASAPAAAESKGGSETKSTGESKSGTTAKTTESKPAPKPAAEKKSSGARDSGKSS